MKRIYGIELYICRKPTDKIFDFIIFTNEFWKWIPGYEGLYKISSLGRVYSIPRTDSMGRFKPGRIRVIHPGINKEYKAITLSKNGKKHTRDIHRLLAETFYTEDWNECVNHLNGNKSHNWISNLKWCTYSENNKHAFDVLLKKPVIAERKMTWEKAVKIRSMSSSTSREDLAKMFNCSVSSISEIILGITWSKKTGPQGYGYRKDHKKHSKYKGVGKSKSGNRWRARIHKDKKEITIGYYDTEIEAAIAFNKKSIELFGEFAYLNDIPPRKNL